MASNITVSGLVVTPGLGQIFLAWSYNDPNSPKGLTYLQLDRVEIWAATSNDRSLATKLSVEGFTSAIHLVSDGLDRFYWIRARDRSGQYGDWYPSSPTAGVESGATGSLAASGWWKLPPGLILQWGVATFTDTTDVTYPHAFTEVYAALAVVVLSSAPAGNELYSAFVNKDVVGPTQLRLYARKQVDGTTSSPSLTVNWFAIGR